MLDEITSLPGLDYPIKFKQYSGFLQASPTRFIHYWFVESQNSPTTDPLIAWFHGGPGLSSLRALLKENGPFRLSASGRTIKPNAHSWNKFANVIYMESPVGVGYSYATDRNLTNDDESASLDNYEALKQFYARYPDLRNRTLFLTGEEYAARTTAQLAKRIINGNSSFPLDLQGVLVADADADTNLTSASLYHYAHSQRLMSDRNWRGLVENCCPGHMADECFYNVFDPSPACGREIGAMDGLWAWKYNLYDIRYKCGYAPSATSPMIRNKKTMLRDTNYGRRDCYEQYGGGLKAYLSRDDVREALHVSAHVANCYGRKVGVDRILAVKYWNSSSECRIYYFSSYNATDVYRFLLGSGVRVLFYYGERNVWNNYEAGSRFADSLGLSYDPDRDVDNAPWYVATGAGFDGTFSGSHRTFAVGNLSVVLIRNAGAVAARTAPLEVNYVVRTFMQGMPL